MPVKKNNYIAADLDFAEKQLASWKAYVEKHPIEELKDRMDYKETKTGGVIPVVIASIEAQGKFLQETMKNYLTLLEVVDKLRQAEEKKQISVRGNQGLSPFEEGEI